MTKEIDAIADREDVARRLMTIPGIGALGATALLAAIGNGQQFRTARDLAAWHVWTASAWQGLSDIDDRSVGCRHVFDL